MTVTDIAGAVFFHAELRVGRATMLDRRAARLHRCEERHRFGLWFPRTANLKVCAAGRCFPAPC
jgi:hypothetical protein